MEVIGVVSETLSGETKDELIQIGIVASLHLHHPKIPNEKMIDVSSFTVVEGKGIMEDIRFYDRGLTKRGKPFLSHITMIDRGQIRNYAMFSGVDEFSPGVFRSNIETEGIKFDITKLKSKKIYFKKNKIGEGFCARTPCGKMDDVSEGLQRQMWNNGSGVIIQAIGSGQICEKDGIYINRNDFSDEELSDILALID